MKKLFSLFIVLNILLTKISFAQNTFPVSGAVGIGTTTPDGSSLLDVTSASKGVLIPRMTKMQRDAIVSPAQGLLIYQTNNTPGFYFYSGVAWTAISVRGANASLSNLTAPTAINTDLIPGSDNTNDIGSVGKSWKDLYMDGSLYLIDNRFIKASLGSNENMAIGIGAMVNFNSAGFGGNTAIGEFAISANQDGELNTAVGYQSLMQNTGGYLNVANGAEALAGNTTGAYNTALGWSALGFNNVTGDNNTAVGERALALTSTGYNNTALGPEACYSNVSGAFNTAIGSGAMSDNTTGFSNVAVGVVALGYNSTRSNLVAVGDSALFNNGLDAVSSVDATANAAVGSKALYANTTGRANSALGFQSLYSNNTGIHNSALGYHSIYSCTTGSDNTALGYTAGLSLISGSNNTFIGSGADCGTLGTVINSTAIGNGASVTNSNNFVFGNGSVVKWGFGHTAASGNIVDFANTTAKLTTGGVWTNASDRKLKDRFEKLDNKSILDKVNALDIERWHYIADGGMTTHIGPVAQDFHEAFGVGDDTTISTIDPSGVALLAIQALSKENSELKKENSDQQKQIDDLKNIVLDMQQSLSQCCSLNSPSGKESSGYQSSLSNKNATANYDVPSLEQNIPNPFDQETTIQFYLPLSVGSAQILVNDLSGKLLKTYSVQGSGVREVNMQSAELAAGTYQYSLLINGKVVDTRQMVITK